MGEGAGMIEKIPLPLVFGEGSMVGITVRGVNEYTLIFAGAQRAGAGSITPGVFQLGRIMIVRIGKIVDPAALMHPGSLMEIFQSFHRLHFTIYSHHVVLQLSAPAMAAAAIVQVSLSIIVHEYAGIDHGFQPLDITLDLEVAGRFLTGGHPDLPGVVPLLARTAGMREIKIIGAVLIGAVRRPHKSPF